MTYRPTLATLNKVKNSKELLSNACLNIFINQKPVEALIDTGSTENYICGKYAKEHSLKIHPSLGIVSIASPTHTCSIVGYCLLDIIDCGEQIL